MKVFFSFTSTIFQQACEWPASAYRQIEKGLLLDLSFFSAPLVRNISKHTIKY